MIFRQEIYEYQMAKFDKIIGSVELDESYFGASRVKGNKVKLKRGRGTSKQPVFGVFIRNGEVFTEIVPDVKKATLQAIIERKIDVKSVIYTDGWRGYDGLVDVGYDKHFRVNHGKNEFALDGDIHINGIESFSQKPATAWHRYACFGVQRSADLLNLTALRQILSFI